MTVHHISAKHTSLIRGSASVTGELAATFPWVVMRKACSVFRAERCHIWMKNEVESIGYQTGLQWLWDKIWSNWKLFREYNWPSAANSTSVKLQVRWVGPKFEMDIALVTTLGSHHENVLAWPDLTISAVISPNLQPYSLPVLALVGKPYPYWI